MSDLEKVAERVRVLTKEDKKSDFELLASATEELGELARELLIEDKSFGNTYKKSDEGSIMESVDLTICGLAIYFRRGGDMKTLSEKLNKKLDKWKKGQES